MPDGSGLGGDQAEVWIVLTSDDLSGAARASPAVPARAARTAPAQASRRTLELCPDLAAAMVFGTAILGLSALATSRFVIENERTSGGNRGRPRRSDSHRKFDHKAHVRRPRRRP